MPSTLNRVDPAKVEALEAIDRLVRAAPDLLAACRMALGVMMVLDACDSMRGFALTKAIDALRAAIAKAEGSRSNT